jgi:hypothetical protein
MYRRYRPLSIPQGQPRPLLVSRYARMNPLLRLFNLQALFAFLPDPLRTTLIWSWMEADHFKSVPALQGRERQRLPPDLLRDLPARRLAGMSGIELEVGQRIVEISRTEISQQERARLLREQGAYLAHLYYALVAQLGEATAQAIFARRVQPV